MEFFAHSEMTDPYQSFDGITDPVMVEKVVV